MRKLIMSLAAIGLVTTPLAAQTTYDDDRVDAVSAAPIIGFALAAIAVAIFALDSDEDDNEPVSP